MDRRGCSGPILGARDPRTGDRSRDGFRAWQRRGSGASGRGGAKADVAGDRETAADSGEARPRVQRRPPGGARLPLQAKHRHDGDVRTGRGRRRVRNPSQTLARAQRRATWRRGPRGVGQPTATQTMKAA